jgi:hypothetical protein
MSDIGKLIDEVVALGLKQLMKENGFKKKRRNFYKEENGVYQILNVQGSIFNDANEGRFTVNLGIFFPEINKLVGIHHLQGVPTEPDCTLRQRVGHLTPQGTDHWWRVQPGDPIEQIAEHLKSLVANYGLPWLDRNRQISVALPLLKKQNPFVAAATALYEGNREEAKKIINDLIARKTAAASHARYWGKKHRLIEE